MMSFPWRRLFLFSLSNSRRGCVFLSTGRRPPRTFTCENAVDSPPRCNSGRHGRIKHVYSSGKSIVPPPAKSWTATRRTSDARLVARHDACSVCMAALDRACGFALKHGPP